MSSMAQGSKHDEVYPYTYDNRVASNRARTYKPASIKASVLLAFTALLAAYVALIEVVLSQSSKPEAFHLTRRMEYTPYKREIPLADATTGPALTELLTITSTRPLESSIGSSTSVTGLAAQITKTVTVKVIEPAKHPIYCLDETATVVVGSQSIALARRYEDLTKSAADATDVAAQTVTKTVTVTVSDTQCYAAGQPTIYLTLSFPKTGPASFMPTDTDIAVLSTATSNTNDLTVSTTIAGTTISMFTRSSLVSAAPEATAITSLSFGSNLDAPASEPTISSSPSIHVPPNIPLLDMTTTTKNLNGYLDIDPPASRLSMSAMTSTFQTVMTSGYSAEKTFTTLLSATSTPVYCCPTYISFKSGESASRVGSPQPEDGVLSTIYQMSFKSTHSDPNTSPELDMSTLSTSFAMSSSSIIGIVPTYSITKTSATRSTSLSATYSTTSTPWPIRRFDENEMIVKHHFTLFSYFAAIFLAPLLAVLLKSCWEIIYSSFKLMEPFERLVKGSTAENSLFIQYLSCIFSLDTIRSVFSGRFVPLLSGAVYMFATILATLTTSAMTVQGTDNCLTPLGYMRCSPVWVINVVILRCIEGILITCVVFVLLLVVSTKRSRSYGLSTNPSSIASMAALLNDDALIRHLQSIGSRASISELAANLGHHRFRLKYHEDASGISHYGITQSNSGEDETASLVHSLAPTIKENKWSTWLSENTQAVLLDVAQFVTSLGLFIVVLVYFLDRSPDAFNKFFNSDSWQPRVLLVGVASLLDLQWKRLEREVRIIEPYRRLEQGASSPETTILMNLHGTCWSELPICLYNLVKRRKGMVFQVLISMVTALSEFNIIAAAGVAYSQAQTLLSLKICSCICLSITALMTLAIVITMIWWRRFTVVKKIPRCPDTIGATFSYLCASQMMKDLGQAHLEDFNGKERDVFVIAMGKKYVFGEIMGLDGIRRWSIDYEEARSRSVAHIEEFSYALSTDEDLRSRSSAVSVS